MVGPTQEERSPFKVSSLRMEKEQSHMTERILDLTLEIIYLLTGENYGPLRKASKQVGGLKDNPNLFKGPLLSSLTPEKENDKKILEVTKKIIELLTGEVPIRCQDVTVYFSMEEWEYLEGHKDLYNDVMIEDQPPLTSPDKSRNRNPPERFPSPLDSLELAQEDNIFSPDYYDEDVVVIKVGDMYNDRLYRMDDESKEEDLPPQVAEDERCNENSPEKHPVICLDSEIDDDNFPEDCPVESPFTPILHPVHYNNNLSSDPSTYGQCFPDPPHPVMHYSALTVGEMSQGFKYSQHLSQRENLHLHRRSQTGSKKFECTECGKCFTQTSHLVTHQRIHTGEKPHSCPICGKCFNDKSYLVTHQKIHTGEKPFSCSNCGKAFAKRSNLVRHQRIHTGEKPYSCSQCGKCFTWKPSLLYHQIKHTSDKPITFPSVTGVFHQHHF